MQMRDGADSMVPRTPLQGSSNPIRVKYYLNAGPLLWVSVYMHVCGEVNLTTCLRLQVLPRKALPGIALSWSRRLKPRWVACFGSFQPTFCRWTTLQTHPLWNLSASLWLLLWSRALRPCPRPQLPEQQLQQWYCRALLSRWRPCARGVGGIACSVRSIIYISVCAINATLLEV